MDKVKGEKKKNRFVSEGMREINPIKRGEPKKEEKKDDD